MFDRIKRAWKVLRGKDSHYTHKPAKVVYVDRTTPHIVQLCYYRDDIVCLDGLGRLWLLSLDHSGQHIIQFMMESPTKGGY